MTKRREKFVDLAEKRVTKALNAIRLVGNLSNRHFYEYTESDVKQLTKALEDEIATMRRRFSDENKKKEQKFKLK